MSPRKKVKRAPPDRFVNITELLIRVAGDQQTLTSPKSRLPALDETEIVSRALAMAHEDALLEEMAHALHYCVGIFTHGIPFSSDDVKARYREFLRDDPNFRKSTLDQWDSVAEERIWFREALATIAGRKRGAIKALHAELPDTPINVVVIPKMVWTGTALHRDDKVACLSVGGMCVYVVMLLLDMNRDLGHALRRCKLKCCNRFFLSFPSAAGGPRPSYCIPDHRIWAAKLTGAERTARWRAKQTTKKRGKK